MILRLLNVETNLSSFMSSEFSDRARFPVTSWSLISRASGSDLNDREKALEEVCRLYWPPIYAYIRAQGHKTHDAEDLTQAFFEELLGKDKIAKADQSRGRLRSYLLGTLKHFLADEHRKGRRLKRGGAESAVRIDLLTKESIGDLIQANPKLTPDLLYDRLWTMRIMETALDEVRDRYRDKGQEELFDQLNPWMKQPEPGFDLAVAARNLGMSEAAVKVAAFRLRQRYGKCLRKVVAETLEPGSDPGEELRYLISTLA